MNTIGEMYDRYALLYEYGERILELYLTRKRKVLFDQIGQDRILEVGIGTGRSIHFYNSGTEIIAGDLSRNMLRLARRRALSRAIFLRSCLFNVENLPFRNSEFSAALSSLVFCTVENPIMGLQEIRRVLKPSGLIYMIEHVRPCSRTGGILFGFLNLLSVPLLGDHLNRTTADYVVEAGFKIRSESCFFGGVFKIIIAEKV